MGKVVLTANTAPSGAPISAEGGYLITGGFGALGLRLAAWLRAQGAQHIILMGRNPDASLIEDLDDVTAHSLQADVADEEQLAAALDNYKGPPLKGVFHAAGVLDDGILLHQDWQRFRKVAAAKVLGGWNLHHLTEHMDLDHFVCFSSVASLLGSSGQSNYAVANGFLDGLAHYRRSCGLAGTSINWGPWADSGMAGADDYSGRGLNHLRPQEALACLEQILKTGKPQVAAMAVNWSHLSHVRNGLPPLTAALAPVRQHKQQTILNELAEMAVEKRRGFLSQYLRERVALVLGTAADAIPTDTGFFQMGMDSLTSVELRNHLQTALNCNLPATLTFDYPTVNALLPFLAELCRIELDGAPETNAEKDANLAEVEELSEDEAEAVLLKELENFEF